MQQVGKRAVVVVGHLVAVGSGVSATTVNVRRVKIEQGSGRIVSRNDIQGRCVFNLYALQPLRNFG